MLRDGSSDAKDLLKWRISAGGVASVSDLKDPVEAEPSVAVCLYDGSGAPQPLLAAAVPAGGACGSKPCWKALGGPGGYRYKNKGGGPDGVTDLKLRIAPSGELALAVKGKGASLPLPTLGLTTPVTVQLVVGDLGATDCWEARFTGAQRNDEGMFRASAP